MKKLVPGDLVCTDGSKVVGWADMADDGNHVSVDGMVAVVSDNAVMIAIDVTHKTYVMVALDGQTFWVRRNSLLKSW